MPDVNTFASEPPPLSTEVTLRAEIRTALKGQNNTNADIATLGIPAVNHRLFLNSVASCKKHLLACS